MTPSSTTPPGSALPPAAIDVDPDAAPQPLPAREDEQALEGAAATAAAPPRRRRLLLWAALVGLLVVAQSLLVWLTVAYESNRAQEEVETAAAGVVADVRQAVTRDLQSLQALMWAEQTPAQWLGSARELLHSRRELLRIERRDVNKRILDAADTPFQPPLFSRMPRQSMELEAEIACAAATRMVSPAFSRSYFVPLAGGLGMEVIDVCLPEQRAGQIEAYLTGTIALQTLLSEVVGPTVLRSHELSFIDADGTRLARAGLPRGAAVYVAERLIDLPGQTMRLRVDSRSGRPRLIPNLAVALVLGLSLALGVVVVLLARDVRRRSAAELALAEALAFRKAMEDSLVTGLRARDLQGRVDLCQPGLLRDGGLQRRGNHRPQPAALLAARPGAVLPAAPAPAAASGGQPGARRRHAGAGRLARGLRDHLHAQQW